MRQKSMSKNDPAERTVRDIRRKTRKQYTAEEKIRIVVSGLRGEVEQQRLRGLPVRRRSGADIPRSDAPGIASVCRS